MRNNQLKKLDVVRELPNLRKLLVEGNPLTLEEIRSLIKHVDKTTRTIFVDIAGSVTCICGNKSFPYSSLSFCRRVEIQIGVYSRLSLLNKPTGGGGGGAGGRRGGLGEAFASIRARVCKSGVREKIIVLSCNI